MYASQPSLVLGFHGCDEAVAEEIFAGNTRLRPSKNLYDWLGSGIYFWEQNPARALQFAEALRDRPERSRGPEVKNPVVVGAVIDLGYCLNLLDSASLDLVGVAHSTLKESLSKVDQPMPVNQDVKGDHDLLLRFLDRAVIESLHGSRQDEQQKSFDSVRAVFPEGKPLYEGAGFRNHSHIQICVRNPNCIKGYFRALKPLASHSLP